MSDFYSRLPVQSLLSSPSVQSLIYCVAVSFGVMAWLISYPVKVKVYKLFKVFGFCCVHIIRVRITSVLFVVLCADSVSVFDMGNVVRYCVKLYL